VACVHIHQHSPKLPAKTRRNTQHQRRHDSPVRIFPDPVAHHRVGMLTQEILQILA